MKKNFVALFLMWVACGPLCGQFGEAFTIRTDEESDRNVCPECVDKIKDTRKLLSDFVLRYNQYCTFKNTIKGTEDQEITRETMNNFLSLFTNYSKVYNDLMEFPREGTSKDYAEYVERRFRKGIDPDEIQIVDVYLKKMVFDPEENEYEVDLVIRKIMKSYFNDKNKRIVAKKPGRVLDLTFTIRISQNFVPGEVKIYRISGPVIPKKARKKRACELFGSAGLSLPQAAGQSSLSDPSFQARPHLIYGGGLNFFQTVGKSQRNYLTAGIKYAHLSMEIGSEETSFTQSGSLGSSGAIFIDSMVFRNYSEKFKLDQIELQLGFVWTLVQGWKSELGIAMLAKPVFILGMKSEISTNYDFSQRINGQRAWCEVTDRLTSVRPESNGVSGFRAYLSLVPYYEFDFSHASRFRLRLSGDFSYALTNWFPSDRAQFDSGNFRTNSRSIGIVDPSTMSHEEGIVSSLRPHYFDIRVGIVYRLNQ